MQHRATTPTGKRRLGRTLGGAALVLTLGAAVRLVNVEDVLTASGVRFPEDTDANYHVLRAERMLRRSPGAPWRDPAMSWPEGADILWPPGFDASIVAVARLGTARPDREDLARAAAVLPVLLGLGSLLVAAALARRLGAGDGWMAAALLALLPAHAEYTVFGRGDQHAAEILLSTAELWTFWVAVRAARLRGFALGCAAMAALVALSAWTWMASTLFLFVPAGFTAIWYVLAPEEDAVARRAPAALLAGAGAGAALLALSVAAFGAPGALLRGGIGGVGGLHVAASAGVAAFGGVLLAARAARRRPTSPGRRLAEVVVALAGPAAALLAPWPGIREGVRAALAAAAGAGPWYATIEEYRPLFGSGLLRTVVDMLRFGLAIPAALWAAVPLARAWREHRERRPEIALLAVWAGMFLGLAAAALRFGLYASVPLSIAATLGLMDLGAAALRRRHGRLAAVVLIGGALLVVAPAVPQHLDEVPLGVSEEEIAAITALSDAPTAPGREGVLAPWSLGHAIQYFAGRPVLVSPFGTDVGSAPMRDLAAFWFAPGSVEADAVLARRRIGLVLLENPGSDSSDLHAFAPPGTPAPMEARARSREDPLHPTEAYWRLVPVRLYFGDGDAALPGFRLVYEGRPTSSRPLDDSRVKIFGAVPGARLEVSGATGGAQVRASVRLLTNQGRRFVWRTEARADPAGRAALRLPYATGANGKVEADPWIVEDGTGEMSLSISEEDVMGGALVSASLGATSARGGTCQR